MKIFIISDTHFNHKNIIQYSNRPFETVETMNEEMIKRWNSKVGKDDLVIHLGDFALGNEGEIKNKLNGTIILLPGNHDHKSTRKLGFLIIHGNLRIGNLIFSHSPLSKEEIPKGFVNVHGHIHKKESLNGINVSVEKTNYEPLELEELRKLVKEREKS
ncbi:MAG: metallophosphoesterase [Nanoarchaeota archaeon]|nr:metallophosphoesterase [Nanoarchaeota archaeon]